MKKYIRFKKFVAPHNNYLDITYLGKDCNARRVDPVVKLRTIVFTEPYAYVYYTKHKNYLYIDGQLYSVNNCNN